MEKTDQKILQGINIDSRDFSQNNHWYVLYLSPRSEKKVKLLLEKKGIEVYLPIVRVLRQWSDRKKWIEEPLFRGYLFLRTSENQLESCRFVPGALYFLKFEGKHAILRDQDIENIRISLIYPEHLTVNNFQFVEGQKIKIEHGPFKGLEGFISRQQGRRRIQVQIEALGKSLLMDVPAGILSTSEA